jgi:anti-sigma B factor antagonist
MNISAEQHGQVTVVIVDGSLDALTAPDLTEFFSQQIGMNNARLIADLSGLEYTSSAGLRVLLAAVKEARQQGGDLRLAAVTPQVNKVLSMSGFTNIIKIYPDRSSAISSYAA